MTTSGPQAQVDVTDVIVGVRYSLAFGAKGHSRSIKKLTTRCRKILEDVPAASGYPPRRDGAVSLSLHRREMEQRWLELSFIVQGVCFQCPYHARKQCSGARFS